jgi:hypothetical protein
MVDPSFVLFDKSSLWHIIFGGNCLHEFGAQPLVEANNASMVTLEQGIGEGIKMVGC